MKKSARSVSVVFAAALVPMMITSVGCNSCKKDDDDKPATTASAAPPAPTPTPVAPATVVPEEDAGAPADAGVDAGKPAGPGGGGGAGTLAKCCAALQQNANSAPLDQKMYYMAAVQYCNGMRNTPAGQQAFAQIRSFLQGAKMPGACTK
jgi:hypothetical protein